VVCSGWWWCVVVSSGMWWCVVVWWLNLTRGFALHMSNLEKTTSLLGMGRQSNKNAGMSQKQKAGRIQRATGDGLVTAESNERRATGWLRQNPTGDRQRAGLGRIQ